MTILDAHTLAATFVLLSAVLGVLLFLAWIQNRKVQALAWWGATFCLLPIGIGMANLGHGAAGTPSLLIANAVVTFGYGLLYAGCRNFNGRRGGVPASLIGPASWIIAFPFIDGTCCARLLLPSVISASYAALSGWELWRHAPQPLASQRMAIILLPSLAAVNIFRGLFGLPLVSIFWNDVPGSRWSAEMALFLVVYAPALAFTFLSMAKERVEADHRRAEQALRESEEHYRYSVELNPEIPWTANARGSLIMVSPRICEVTGTPVDEVLENGWAGILHPDDVAPTQQRWLDSVSSGEPFDSEYRVRLIDQNYRWFRARAAARLREDGSIIRWYGTLEDIHDRKLAEERLRWAAYHDDLTGLPNRRLLQERLQQALDQARTTGRGAGLLVIDLHDFTQINERYGHEAGDEFLKVFGAKLTRLVRTTDTVARLGGDEFAVVLQDIGAEDDVTRIAGSLQTRIKETLRLNTRVRECSTSIGGAVSAQHNATAEELLKQANLALYNAKVAGRSTFMMFRPIMREEAQGLASALELARSALALDRIAPFYQPKMALASGGLAGFEALLRWHHPGLGIQPPDALAPAFDDPELGVMLGERMLSRVISDIRGWREAGLDLGRIAVNASAVEFRRNGYAERVLDLLHQAGVSPSCLEVEVTEGVLLNHNAETIEQALRTLSVAGVTIALDDFGTGYASLAHLKRFPVDVVKIDRSFVSEMESNAGDAAIVRAVLNLSHKLGIQVVAEGIETLAQASLLWEQGCEFGQGYFFGRPVAGEDVPQLIRAWSCGANWRTGGRVTWPSSYAPDR
ncbi:putative bifunctional diguanylate cyclase/phosphodiesterase [Microvirga yunnanensis]|uniref:putative bifunctional diguanylate cyclase/phosphodiesterase n=1 Tax=Microvirga yunnanensis TaxID=2953740 RepID=UPI0021C91419|nr:EAL domain-containing protein [Microvirga sp. HBU65207]